MSQAFFADYVVQVNARSYYVVVVDSIFQKFGVARFVGEGEKHIVGVHAAFAFAQGRRVRRVEHLLAEQGFVEGSETVFLFGFVQQEDELARQIPDDP